MSTIQEHYEWLQETDPDKWGEFNGKLSAKKTDRSNCLTYFQRSIIKKEENGGHYDTSVGNHYILTLMVAYLGFTWQDIQADYRPALPTLTTVD